MSGQPAARVGDAHVCPAVDAKPHVGGPIIAPASTKTIIGGQLAARLGDRATCVGPPDPIAKGAMPVPIEGAPAARKTDASTHGGSITSGEPTVLIGLAGTTGNPYAGTIACTNAAAGRANNAPAQSYNNCGVESSRQLINHATNGNVTENGLLQQAIGSGWARDVNGDGQIQVPDGGTLASDRINLLSSNGVPAQTLPSAVSPAFELALSNGQGAIVALDAAALWPTTAGITNAAPGSWHAVQVTGITYDDQGNIVSYTINDTGTGQCGVVVPKATMETALNAYTWANETVVTTNPIW